jgi:hypothetical protein
VVQDMFLRRTFVRIVAIFLASSEAESVLTERLSSHLCRFSCILLGIPRPIYFLQYFSILNRGTILNSHQEMGSSRMNHKAQLNYHQSFTAHYASCYIIWEFTEWRH